MGLNLNINLTECIVFFFLLIYYLFSVHTLKFCHLKLIYLIAYFAVINHNNTHWFDWHVYAMMGFQNKHRLSHLNLVGSLLYLYKEVLPNQKCHFPLQLVYSDSASVHVFFRNLGKSYYHWNGFVVSCM